MRPAIDHANSDGLPPHFSALEPGPSLPWPFRLANFLAGFTGFDRLKRYRFTSEEMCGRAQEIASLEDFGDSCFREGLAELLESAEIEADLSPLGRLGIHGMIVTQLVNRLEYANWKKSCPGELALVRPPLIILGLPRSGTTFLHRLMSQDSNLRTLPFWQLMRPFPPSSGPDERFRQAEKALSLRLKLTPELDAKHFVRADSSEECIWLLNQTFFSHGYWVGAPVYNYLKWLEGTNRDQSYREYRDLLVALESEDNSRRLLLKAPAHTGSLDSLLSAIPGAMVVQTHRDPLEVVGSLNSLFYSIHRTVSRRVDPLRMAQANLQSLVQGVNRNVATRESRDNRVFDVIFDELLEDPAGVVRKIYAHFKLSWSEELGSRLVRYVSENPRGKHGVHHYSLERFGISSRTIESEFAPYRKQLGFTNRRRKVIGGRTAAL